jgi:RNA polymerase sigma-70 factor (ECF subfamily)
MIQANTRPVSQSHNSSPAYPTTKDTPTDSAQEAAYDTGLIARFNRGDEDAFVEMMDRYHGKIFGLAHNLLRNAADAEEIAQDTFIRAHRGLATFRGDSSLATWLYRIALNLSRNRYWYFFRRRRQDSISLERPLNEETEGTFSDLIASDTHSPVQETVTQEFTELISTCMEKLDARHREILTMRNVLNLPYEEISRALGINVGTVKSRIARARENLRKLLAELAPEFSKESGPEDFFVASRVAYGCHAIAYA